MGVDSVEHGDGLTGPQMEEMAKPVILLGADDRGGRIRSQGPTGRLTENGGDGEGRISVGADEGREDCVWNGCGRIRLARFERSPKSLSTA